MLHANQVNEPVADDLSLMQRRLDRERRARQQAEAVLEAKSLDLYQKHQELVRLNARLEDRVKQRTEELADAVKKAQQASAAKGEFLARMSHEIRTPMNGVIGMLEALKMTSLQPDQADYAETAYTSATSLLALINDILDFSKIEAGQMAIESIRFDLLEQLQHVVHLWETKAQHSNLYLRSVIDPSIPRWVIGDPTRLNQIITNLISNALKFTHQGGVTLSVAVATDSAPRATEVNLEFSVQDTGIGMSEESLARLFTAFMQADGSTSRRYGGTGLGLAICDQLARLMNGSIAVSSKEGHGTRFTLKLTFGIAIAQDAPSQQLPMTSLNPAGASAHHDGSATTDNEPKFRKGKILVVDDNDTNRKVALTILKRYGIDADTAEDGLQAIRAVQSQHYDLVLMDCHMPVIDGYEATTQIRAWEHKANLPRLTIVAVTASAFQEDRDKCAACGMNDFVAKPVNLRAIRTVLEKWLPLDNQFEPSADSTALPTTTTSISTSSSTAGNEPAQNYQPPTADELDREQYTELRELTGAEFPAMLQQYHRNVQTSLQAMRDAVSSKDAEQLRKIAHRLKGSSATIGATTIASSSASLEAEGRAGRLERAAQFIDELEERYRRLQSWTEYQG